MLVLTPWAMAAAAADVERAVRAFYNVYLKLGAGGVPSRAQQAQLAPLISPALASLLRDARRAIEEVNIAGLTLARLTVDRSPSPDPLPLLRTVAELQRAVAVVRVFAPLPRRFNPAAPSTGFGDVKRVALARIVADNVQSIQVDWSLYGPKLAQVALTVGADDVDGVSSVDDLSQGMRRSPLEEVRRNIRAAGYDPVARNGRFDRLSK